MSEYIDLMLDTGELVRIECPSSFQDELYDTIENAMKRGDWWSPAQFDGCSAKCMGVLLNRISMKRVIGML